MYKEIAMTKKQLRALSRAETEILALLWGLGKGAVQDVCDILPSKRQIAYATVQTLLRRLESKGYVTHEVKGKAYVFRPSIKREEVIKRTVGDFVDRLFGGDPVPLLLHLANHSGLNPADVKRLKKLLEREES
jgi:BlaI family penicillinase repressor